jgi:uncharacterized small protein (DUF1192 family)
MEENTMSLFADENAPRKVAAHEVGQDVALLSVKELDERLIILEDEILRLKLARDAKQASKSAADAIFRKG